MSSSHSDLTASWEKSKELLDICSRDIFPSLTLTALAAFVLYLMTQKNQFGLCWEFFFLRKSEKKKENLTLGKALLEQLGPPVFLLTLLSNLGFF